MNVPQFKTIVSVYIIFIILLALLAAPSCYYFDICWIEDPRHTHYIDK